MHQNTDPHACSNIGWASRQVSQLIMKSKIQMLLNQIVKAVDMLPGAFQIVAAFHDLDAQMIFFVDHQTDALGVIDCHGASSVGIGVFATDQLTLDQELAIEAGLVESSIGVDPVEAV